MAKESADPQNAVDERIIRGNINKHMKSSYLDYAYSVIVGRALPDVRDGLKPVHRRIIYSCYQNNYTHDNPYKKSVRIVGDVLGKYHPHGDASVYNTLVRMAQDFSMRYPMVDGQGNFGSIDGDPPAAMRYTEARTSTVTSEMVADIGKDTIDYMPNFDESLQEPIYLPTRIPTLLMNGISGIAVGMRTNMPPYNLHEIVSAIKAVIAKPDMYPEEINNYIKGPDFPTGGIIVGRKGIRHIINRGRGKITIRGVVEIEDYKNHQRLIITELPYEVNKSKLVKKIADLVNKKRLRGVTDLRDESNREGIRVVVDLKTTADPNAIKNKILKYTRLQRTYSVMNLVLIKDGKQPHVLNLHGLITSFINCREDVIIRRTQYDLDKARARLHIIDGLLIAIDNIDDVIKIIRGAHETEDAKTELMDKYAFSEEQVTHILNMPLRRLTGLQIQKLKDEKQQLEIDIEDYKDILASKDRRMQIIEDEIQAIDDKYADERRTRIIDAPDLSGDEKVLKTVAEFTCVVMLTKNQYIKRMKLETYQMQHRGGKGKKGINIREEDIIEDVYVVSSHDKLLLFTENGRIYSKFAFEIPLMSRTSRGKALINFVGLKPDERIVHMIPVSDFEQDSSLIFCTKNGMVKKTMLKEFDNIRRTGVIAVKLREGDSVLQVKLNEPEIENRVLIATKNGYAIKFPETELRPIGRVAMGVIGIRLREGDEIVDMILGTNETDVITITKKGYGKRTKMELYRETRRGGKGVINIKFHESDDYVAVVKSADTEDLLIATTDGMVIRVPSTSLRSLSRSAKGVRVVRLNDGDSVSSVALCRDDDEDDGVSETASEEDVDTDEEEIDEKSAEIDTDSEEADEDESDNADGEE